MKRRFCDKCGNEIKRDETFYRLELSAINEEEAEYEPCGSRELCRDCIKSLRVEVDGK